MNMPSPSPALRHALHSLHAPPTLHGWNQPDWEDVLPPSGRMRQAAVLVGLVPRAHGTQVLLTRRTEALREHAGQVSFPGGRIEPDDRDAAAAAIRETGEEIAIPPAHIAPIGYLDPLLTISGFRVMPVAAWIAPDYVARPDPAEVADVFEVPLDYLLAQANRRHFDVDYRGRKRRILEYVNGADGYAPPHRIWGATAAILDNLAQRLAQAGQ